MKYFLFIPIRQWLCDVVGVSFADSYWDWAALGTIQTSTKQWLHLGRYLLGT